MDWVEPGIEVGEAINLSRLGLSYQSDQVAISSASGSAGGAPLHHTSQGVVLCTANSHHHMLWVECCLLGVLDKGSPRYPWQSYLLCQEQLQHFANGEQEVVCSTLKKSSVSYHSFNCLCASGLKLPLPKKTSPKVDSSTYLPMSSFISSKNDCKCSYLEYFFQFLLLDTEYKLYYIYILYFSSVNCLKSTLYFHSVLNVSWDSTGKTVILVSSTELVLFPSCNRWL